MDSCCSSKADELALLRKSQRGVLQIVFAINLVMFAVEAAGGLFASSSALLADSLDMFGDASVYALTLFVLDRSPPWRARAALTKGLIMLAFGLGVLGATILQLIGAADPIAPRMGAIGVLALAANLCCLMLLTRHRSDDLNMRSTWLCSRNDIIANVAVLIAAILVWLTDHGSPDIVVGFGIALLFLRSSLSVVADSRKAICDAR